ncbi:MAG: hypothetical protein ACRCXB_14055 [Aeromonadaceae bacterium]
MKYEVMFASSLIAPGTLATLEWFAKAYPVTTWFALLATWVLLMFVPMFVPMFVRINNADKQLKEYEQ